jgi:hypothetical protein
VWICQLADLLLRQETVDGEAVYHLLGLPQPTPPRSCRWKKTWSRRRRDGWPCAVLPEGPPGMAEI